MTTREKALRFYQEPHTVKDLEYHLRGYSFMTAYNVTNSLVKEGKIKNIGKLRQNKKGLASNLFQATAPETKED